MVEEHLPSQILYFFAFLFFLSAVVVFFSAREDVIPLSGTLGVAFVVLGEALVRLVFAH
jgi:hypothetical protein